MNYKDKFNAVCELFSFMYAIDGPFFVSYVEELERCYDFFERQAVMMKYTYIFKRLEKQSVKSFGNGRGKK